MRADNQIGPWAQPACCCRHHEHLLCWNVESVSGVSFPSIIHTIESQLSNPFSQCVGVLFLIGLASASGLRGTALSSRQGLTQLHGLATDGAAAPPVSGP